MEIMATPSSSLLGLSVWKTIEQRLLTREGLILRTSEIRDALPQLSTVRSCAMIGCGTGHNDLAFVRECCPNLTELTAVDPDADQMAEFMQDQRVPADSNCERRLLPGDGSKLDRFFSGKQFDAVLLFHCLYCRCVLPSEHPVLFKKLFDHVVVSGGLVLILLHPSDLQNPKGIDRLKRNLDIDGVQIRDMITSVGFRDCYQLEIECQLDLQEPNDDLMSTIVFINEGKLSLEEARRSVKEVFGSMKIVPHQDWFGAFRRP